MVYPADLRVRYIQAVHAGRSARSQAKVFQIGASTGVKWMQAYRVDGHAHAKSHGGGMALAPGGA